MYELFLALFLAFSCPAHNDNANVKVSTQGSVPGNPGGDDGHIPPKPPKP